MLIGAVCLFVCASPAADFRVDSNLVLIPVSVTDAGNHAVTGLEAGAFRVYDNKAEQTVVQFAREDAPLSVGIVFDVSGSMKDKLGESRAAVEQFLRGANPEDEFFLVEFNDRARLTVPFTTDCGDIRDRLLRAEPGGRTALLDAVRLAMDSMKTARYARRALLILSDGGDNDSRYTAAEVLSRERETDLWIYALGIYDHHTPVLPEESGSGQELLQALAEASGGRHYAAERPADLPEVAGRIGVELRNRYILGYRPGDSRRDGKYHRVQVKMVDGRHVTVSWRRGYYGVVE